MPSIGITGIQRNIQTRLDQQDQKINSSFKDLSVLMNEAKEMVKLSTTITAKLAKQAANRSGGGGGGQLSVNEDENVKLKSYFANMGIIDSPVTKEGSGSKYFKDLAMEISRNLTGINKLRKKICDSFFSNFKNSYFINGASEKLLCWVQLESP